MNKKTIIIIIVIIAVIGIGYYFFTRNSPSAQMRTAVLKFGADHESNGNGMGVVWQTALGKLSDTDIANMYNVISNYFGPGQPNLYASNPGLGAFWDSFLAANPQLN